MSSEKGKFSTDIAQNLIDAAMRSVDKAKAEVHGTPVPEQEVEVPIEAPAAAPPPAEEAPAADAAQKEIESLKAMLELATGKTRELTQKLKDEHERTLRAAADLENYKRRAAKEREEVQRFGIEKLLKDFLPVVDNFDRALEHARSGGDMKSLQDGVAMVRKLFEDALQKHGVKAFDAVGKPFDPNFHEAMGQMETAAQAPNTVVKELVRGFTLNDRLVRPALVMVAKAPAPKPEAPKTEAKTEPNPESSPAPADPAGEKKS